MTPPFGTNQMMKRCLQNYNMEFEDIKRNLAEIGRRVVAKSLTSDQARELQKETREMLFILNKKVMESFPTDSRATAAQLKVNSNE